MERCEFMEVELLYDRIHKGFSVMGIEFYNLESLLNLHCKSVWHPIRFKEYDTENAIGKVIKSEKVMFQRKVD